MGGFLLDILEFVILVLFIKGLMRSLGSFFKAPRVHIRTSPIEPVARPSEAHRGEMARDPVCGMFVSTELSQQLKLRGETLHFCSRQCLEKYQKDAHHVAS